MTTPAARLNGGECPHNDDCGCSIGTRHEWYVWFCEATKKLRGRGAVLAEPAETEKPPVLKTVCDLRDTSKLLARFYDYDYFERVMQALAGGAAPRPKEKP